MSDALSGIRVLECAHFIAGPRTTQLLADHGAEVIKLEPLSGDPSRGAEPRWQGHSLYFFSHNRRKKSVAVDLKCADGQEVLRRLIAGVDVIVTNYTPGTAAKLGLDLAAASRSNPRIVVVQITAFGLDVDDPNAGGFDGTIQGLTGIADLIGAADGPPTVTAMPIIDHLTAIDAAYGTMLALRRRDLTGEAQSVDVSLYDVAMSILAYAYGDVLLRKSRPRRNGSRAPYAFTTAYRAKDGYVYVAPISPKMWSSFCELVGHPEWAAPGSPYLEAAARLRDRAQLEPQIEDWTTQHTRDEIVEIFSHEGIACGKVNEIDEAITSPLAEHRHMVEWVSPGASSADRIPVPGTELKIGPGNGSLIEPVPVVPDLGEDTAAVLADLGFEAPAVAELRAAGVIA